jgi:hypothetical protein
MSDPQIECDAARVECTGYLLRTGTIKRHIIMCPVADCQWEPSVTAEVLLMADDQR